MWRVARVPRVSCCTDSAKTPGNRTENPPSSRPCRDWPDCLAVGAGRSEPVSPLVAIYLSLLPLIRPAVPLRRKGRSIRLLRVLDPRLREPLAFSKLARGSLEKRTGRHRSRNPCPSCPYSRENEPPKVQCLLPDPIQTWMNEIRLRGQ